MAGSLVQLAGRAGCESTGGLGGCYSARGIDGPGVTAVSPDGLNVYVASNNSSAVSAFRRDRTSGALHQLSGTSGCVSETGADGCTHGRGLVGAYALALSGDGRFAYVGAFNGVAVFARDPATGALHQLDGAAGCVSQRQGDGCTTSRALQSTASLALSPDPQSRSLYVASTVSDAVAIFTRDPGSGALTQAPGVAGCVSQDGSEGCATGRALSGAIGVGVSPDGRGVAVAAFDGNAVALFARDLGTGALAQLPVTFGCLSQAGTDSCTTGRALASPNAVTFSPDSNNAYVAASGSSAVSAFAREPKTTTLAQLGGREGCVSERGLEGCANGRNLGGAVALAFAPGGRALYVASLNGVTLLSRTSPRGALVQPGGAGGCASQGGTEGCSPARGLAGASSVAISPDARNAYVTGFASNAVAVFLRAPLPSPPAASLAGVPHSCVRTAIRVRGRARGPLAVVRSELSLDNRGTRRGTSSLGARFSVRKLRPGVHRLVFAAYDVAGQRGLRSATFRRCRARRSAAHR